MALLACTISPKSTVLHVLVHLRDYEPVLKRFVKQVSHVKSLGLTRQVAAAVKWPEPEPQLHSLETAHTPWYGQLHAFLKTP